MTDPTVRIRTYRIGLGDCHLLTFSLARGVERNILIDCGYFPGSQFDGITAERIVDHIAASTNGQLDAVVVTHEHQDHLQGFVDAEEKFDEMKLSELWLAWTEKPGQKIVLEKRTIAALEAAASGLALTDDPQIKEMALAIESMLGFSKGTDEAFETVKSWFPANARKYWNPGDIIEPSWLPGVRIYVLGPPKDLAALRKMTGKKNVEMYEIASDQFGFAAAALDEMEPGTLSPFNGKYARAKLHSDLKKSYDAPGEEWRRIDSDWLMSASRLALQYDSYTNNTSLVLAFELKASGDVLLFVGDAQIGNWESWQSLSFKHDHTTTNAADLLSRTVFYKVGHHGSHNATLVDGGLLSMTSPELNAAIPTHEDWARTAKNWEMPNARLFKALKNRCASRVLRTDAASAKSLFVEHVIGTQRTAAGASGR